MESESRRTVERRIAERRRQSLVLIHSFLTELNLRNTAASLLEEYRDQSLSEFEAVENISLPVLISEYESSYESRFDKKPQFIRPRISVPLGSKAKKPGKDENGQKASKVLVASDSLLEVVGHQSTKPTQAIFPREVSIPPSMSSELKELAQAVLSDYKCHSQERVEIFGLSAAQQSLEEAVVWPMEHAEFFASNRNLLGQSWRAVLLFGPPGNGKTLLARAVAQEKGVSFFPVTPSLILSKWRGESEKMVKVLFELAAYNAPGIIFIDEIDAIFAENLHVEHEATRRMKAELLAAMDGVEQKFAGKVFVIGATNFPWRLSDALLRRFEKRILVSEPEEKVRKKLVNHLLPDTGASIDQVVQATHGWSCDDIRVLCKEAVMTAMRRAVDKTQGKGLKLGQVLVTTQEDLLNALHRTKPACSENFKYKEWALKFGNH